MEGGERLPARIQVTQKPVLEDSVCLSSYGQRFQSPAVLCAGYTWGGQDACQGTYIHLKFGLPNFHLLMNSIKIEQVTLVDHSLSIVWSGA